MSLVPALRRLSLFALFVSVPLLGIGCAAEAPSGEEAVGDGNEIVDVPQTAVERQSIGNCWIYAEASWAESMNLQATGRAFDVSQSYWTYWHWFDQIAGGANAATPATAISRGNFATAGNLVRKYGLMAEADFVAADSADEMSLRQKEALTAINASLKDGALKTASARRNKKLVRAELDRAWRLTEGVTKSLTQVFGETVNRTFASAAAPAVSEGTSVISPKAFPVAYTQAVGAAPVQKSLFDATTEWRQNSYAAGSTGRVLLQRVQRALHDKQPVMVSWYVDFNAMDEGSDERRGSFNLMTLSGNGAGRQGGHMTVFEDYDATLSDGTRLAAGTTLNPQAAADKAKLEKALASDTKINFFRIKNSWGAARLDRTFAPGMPGYHDLYMDYLDGPIPRCAEVNGETDTTNCTAKVTPLQYVILPPGY